MNENDKLEILKDILFDDGHKFEEKISKRVKNLEETLNQRKKLSGKVNPLIEQQINEFKESIPGTLGPVITETLREEIKYRKDEVVDALYPIMGKMVKKYVAQEMQLLQERIDNQLSFLTRWKRKLRSIFSGKKEEDLIIDDLATAKIEQVLLIEKDSGILKASFSKSNTMDEEMVSGMLTAIKSFVEDAFNQRNQNLESIEYELYQIHLQSFATHYIAVVISGNFVTSAKNKLQDVIFNFYNRFMAMNLDLVFDSENAKKKVSAIGKPRIERELKKHFGNAKI
jgi:hypothetical protein